VSRGCRHHDVEKLGARARPLRGSAGVGTEVDMETERHDARMER
jgi:hypothetical protein